MNLFELTVPSPIGPLRLVANDDALVALHTPPDKAPPGKAPPVIAAEPGEGHPVLAAARRQLEEYLNGTRVRFDLPLRLGGTEFQRAVWQVLLEIPCGDTWSYADVARRLGRPDGVRAVRAVGAANGRNPIAIIVPCHRVIGADGSLTGYAGGLEVKRWLLDHEAATSPRQRALDFGR